MCEPPAFRSIPTLAVQVPDQKSSRPHLVSEAAYASASSSWTCYSHARQAAEPDCGTVSFQDPVLRMEDKHNTEKSQIATRSFKATLKSVNYPTGNHVTDKDPWKVSTLNGRKDPLCNQESWLHIKHQIVLRHNGTFCCCCYDTHGVTAHGPATRQKSSEDNCNLSF